MIEEVHLSKAPVDITLLFFLRFFKSYFRLKGKTRRQRSLAQVAGVKMVADVVPKITENWGKMKMGK